MDIKTLQDWAKSLRGNRDFITAETTRLDGELDACVDAILQLLTPTQVLPTARDSILRELKRLSEGIGGPVSDLAGQMRFLRGLIASRTTVEVRSIGQAPATDRCLVLLKEMWNKYFYREMAASMVPEDKDSPDAERRSQASLMALLASTQTDLSYPERAEERALAICSPFDADVIVPGIGLTTAQCIEGMQAIWSCIQLQRDQALDLVAGVNAGLDSSSEAHIGLATPDVNQVIEAKRLLMAGVAAYESHLEVSRASLPGSWSIENRNRFFSAFGFAPGSINQAFRRPFDDNELLRRPLMALGADQFLLLEPLYCRFAPMRRLVVLFDTDALRQRLHKRRSQWLEERARSLFGRLLTPQFAYHTYYVLDSNHQLAEQDLLMGRDGHGFVVEAKSKPLRHVGRTHGNAQKLLSDFQAGVEAGHEQCRRAHEYLCDGADPVPLYDDVKNVIGTVARSELKYVHRIVLLDESYTLAATDMRMWLKLQPGEPYPWVVDQDTLETILLRLNQFDKFVEFLDWRSSVHGKMTSQDEACFAGFFLTHGAVVPPDAKVVMLDEHYSDMFDAAYFGSTQPLEPPKAPVYTEIVRRGDEVHMSIDGKLVDIVQLRRKPDKANRPDKLPRRFKVRRRRSR